MLIDLFRKTYPNEDFESVCYYFDIDYYIHNFLKKNKLSIYNAVYYQDINEISESLDTIYDVIEFRFFDYIMESLACFMTPEEHNLLRRDNVYTYEFSNYLNSKIDICEIFYEKLLDTEIKVQVRLKDVVINPGSKVEDSEFDLIRDAYGEFAIQKEIDSLPLEGEYHISMLVSLPLREAVKLLNSDKVKIRVGSYLSFVGEEKASSSVDFYNTEPIFIDSSKLELIADSYCRKEFSLDEIFLGITDDVWGYAHPYGIENNV